jgi:hypothetical protein
MGREKSAKCSIWCLTSVLSSSAYSGTTLSGTTLNGWFQEPERSWGMAHNNRLQVVSRIAPPRKASLMDTSCGGPRSSIQGSIQAVKNMGTSLAYTTPYRAL